MTQDRQTSPSITEATLRPGLALACLIGALASPALAQDPLPSVNDYRLPSGTSSPRVRPQGPVDLENPEASVPRAVRTAEPTPTPSASAAAPTRRSGASPAPAASTAPRAAPATPSAAQRTAATPATQAAASPARQASPVQASPIGSDSPAPASAAPSPTASPSVMPSPPLIEWRVHSASGTDGGGWTWWQLILVLGLALLSGAGLVLLLQRVQRWRRADPAPAAEMTETLPSPARQPPVEAMPEPAAMPELDLLTVMAEPLPPGVPTAERPALNVHVNPLVVELAARRLSATLMNAVLNYELVVRNTGSTAIGPVTVGGDMIGAHASLPTRAQLELAGQDITALHRLPSLGAGESVTLSGEFKLALADITPIRSGNAALFIPLARFRIEAARNGAPPLVASSAFVVGEDQDRPGAALRPFRLDLGPRLYSRIGQRELALSA